MRVSLPFISVNYCLVLLKKKETKRYSLHCVPKLVQIDGLMQKDVTPLITRWSYVFLSLTHWNYNCTNSRIVFYVLVQKRHNTSAIALELCLFRTTVVAEPLKTSHNMVRGPWCQLDNFSWTKKVINTLSPRQNGRHFADIFRSIFLNENAWSSLKISLKFVPKVQIDNIPALV